MRRTLVSAAALVALATPLAAQSPGPAAGYFSQILRSYSLSGCHGPLTVGYLPIDVAPPYEIDGTMCVSGVGTYGQRAGDGLWEFRLDLLETVTAPYPVHPRLSFGGSFVYGSGLAGPAWPAGSIGMYDAHVSSPLTPATPAGPWNSYAAFEVTDRTTSGLMIPESYVPNRIELEYRFVADTPRPGPFTSFYFGSVTMTATPEPGAWALLATGLVAIGAVARRGRRPG